MKTLNNRNSRNRFPEENNSSDFELQMIDEISISEIESPDFDRDILEMPSDMYDSIY